MHSPVLVQKDLEIFCDVVFSLWTKKNTFFELRAVQTRKLTKEKVRDKVSKFPVLAGSSVIILSPKNWAFCYFSSYK